MAPRKDLTGRRFGRLIAVAPAQAKQSTWICRCDCGRDLAVRTSNLTSGRSTSCGCSHQKASLAGRTFGELSVIKDAGRAASGAVAWLCVCSCGTQVIRDGTSLRLGRATSCGCKNRSRTHGQAGSPLYRRWCAMITRATNPNHPEYHNYGGRGITVCDRWRYSFDAFATDMGGTFTPELELDRIDVDGSYSPENCRWVTRIQQMRNIRRNHNLTFRGQTKPIAEWAEILGLNPGTVQSRLARSGWPVERALTTGADSEALARLEIPQDPS